jgi:phosphopantothenoylcysteine decarboxylase/phosphopantothenate--cysteine ligase
LILFRVGPGGSALYAPEVARLLAESGHGVRVYLEVGAREFVGPAAFGGRDAADVTVEPGEEIVPAGISELPESPESPEAIIFAPADAAAISRLSHGLGEGVAFEAYAASNRDVCPAVILPDLDPETAAHPAVTQNVALLEEDGCTVLEGVDPEAPEATSDVAHEIVSRTLHEIGGPLTGLRVVVTAGGTREPVDSVRFVGNRSSGKMGAAIAREAYRQGASVSVVAANVTESEPGVDWHPVETFADLQERTMLLCEDADVLIMAAAVSDFTPASPVLNEKIRRGGRETMTLELAATPDILAGVRGAYPDLFVAGFAATHGDPLPDAREKLRKKGVNLVVGNDISAPGIGFGSEENEAYIVMGRGLAGEYEEHFVPRGPKTKLASAILQHLKPAIKHREV